MQSGALGGIDAMAFDDQKANRFPGRGDRPRDGCLASGGAGAKRGQVDHGDVDGHWRLTCGYGAKINMVGAAG